MQYYRKLLSGALVSILFNVNCLAQQSGPEIKLKDLEHQKGLQVGDRVPDIQFQMYNYSKSTIKLSDFRGKLVILDFWATWCGTCIAAFPKMDSIQASFKGKVQVLLVNSVQSTLDSQKKISDFFKKRKEKGKVIKLGSTIEDSAALKLFPHNAIPHYVWISPDGIVLGITGSDEISYENIKKILDGAIVHLAPKRDFYSNIIFGFGEISIDPSTRYSFFKKGRFAGVGSHDQRRTIQDNDGKSLIVGAAMYNFPLLDLYKSAIFKSVDDFCMSFNNKRIIITVSDSSLLFYDPVHTSRDVWERDNFYTYDLVVQEPSVKDLRNIILNYLNESTGYIGRIEIVKVKCFSIVKIPEFTKLVNKQDDVHQQLANRRRLNAFIMQMNSKINSLPLLMNSTMGNDYVSLDINIDNPDQLDLRNQLKTQGFDMILEERELEMFVISDKQKEK